MVNAAYFRDCVEGRYVAEACREIGLGKFIIALSESLK
jgi:hypothetical protein